jgi:hypothetical protein
MNSISQEDLDAAVKALIALMDRNGGKMPEYFIPFE